MQKNSIIQIFQLKFGKLEKTLDGQDSMWLA
jgi:hypothetical protein